MRIYTTEEFMNKSKGMHIFRCGVSAEPDDTPHKHEFIEIVYILSGRMTHEINDKKYYVKHGDILFMNYGCTHAFYSDGDYSYVNILFSPEMFDDTLITPQNAFSILALTAFNDMRDDSDFGRISFSGSERYDIENIILAMLKEYEEQQGSWEIVLGNYLNTLIIKMLRKNERNIAFFNLDETWNELLTYIDENIDSRLTLAELAQKCFYNPSYFSRIFKEKFGVTFLEYVAKRRLTYAIELLQGTALSLDEIAEQVGFSDTKGLYHAFSRYMDTTPSEYRKNKNVKNKDINR